MAPDPTTAASGRRRLRGPDRPHPKPQGVKRLALVGDSMVAAIATAEQRTLAGRLERLLLSRYSPDLVVLVFWVGNDLADNSLALTRAPRRYFGLDSEGRLRQLPFDFQPSPVVEWLDRTSRLYVRQKSALRQGEPARRGRSSRSSSPSGVPRCAGRRGSLSFRSHPHSGTRHRTTTRRGARSSSTTRAASTGTPPAMRSPPEASAISSKARPGRVVQ